MKHAPVNYVKESQFVQIELLDDLCRIIKEQIEIGRNYIFLDKYVNKATKSIILLYGYKMEWSTTSHEWYVSW